MVSIGNNPPIVTTPIAAMLMDSSTTKIPMVMPSKNIVVAFINRTLNTEDACTVSRELRVWVLRLGGTLTILCPGARSLSGWEWPSKDQKWWAPALEGAIVDIRVSKVGDPIAAVYVASKELRIGDKLGTAHGLKFTVGEMRYPG